MFSQGQFRIGVELVSTRGVPADGVRAKPAELAESLTQGGMVDWFSITDNAGGHPTLPADALGRMLQAGRADVVLHLTCKDRNRNALEAAAWSAWTDGFKSILALTGDYPVEGYAGLAKPVFDTDSVGLVGMLAAMNAGLEVRDRKGQISRLPRTDFYVGCAVSPFKRHESELMPQYFKLLRKLSAGAQWVCPQLGYDMRKFHELLLLCRWAGVSVPIAGNVYVLNRVVAGMYNRNEIPGCVVSDELMAQIDKHAAGPDKGKSFFRELAAKQMAVFRGMGFAGAYFGGVHRPELLGEIVELEKTYAPDDWKQFAREIQFAQPGEFYMFERDEATGLGAPDRVVQTGPKVRARGRSVTVNYRVSRLVHAMMFTPGRGLFGFMRWLYKRIGRKGSALGWLMYKLELTAKRALYRCQDCGDCSLPDCAYMCPNWACSKGQRNGPCGGGKDGWCELQDKTCLWVRAYERLKRYGEEPSLASGAPVYADAALDGTSSWANTYLARDHFRQRTLSVYGEREDSGPAADSKPRP
jgi:methylenetetrahydrofolate reductase (NADPH)